MAPGHWQIVKHGEQKRDYIEGLTQAISLEETPAKVVKMALKAANLIGDGFYGWILSRLASIVMLLRLMITLM